MYTIGADPEFFIRSEAGVHPITGLLGGEKGAPVEVEDDGHTYGMQEDNLMAEYNVPATEAGSSEFAETVTRGRELTLARIRESLPEAQFVLRPEVEFEEHHVLTPQGQMFGCAPDQDAYANGDYRAPLRLTHGSEYPVRFAGGHIHIGHSLDIPNHVIVQFLDATIGLAGVMHDSALERREYYGKAGVYRDKPYGLEYRTPSNWWIWSKDHAEHVESTVFYLLSSLEGEMRQMQEYYSALPLGDIERAIRFRNLPLAQDIVSFMGKKGCSPIARCAKYFGLYV